MVLALNKVLSQVGFHQAGKRAVRNTTFVPDLDAHPALAADNSAAAFLKMVMDEQVAALPESNRAIIRLRTEGYEVEEIVRSTGRARRTVERVLQDFRARLTHSRRGCRDRILSRRAVAVGRTRAQDRRVRVGARREPARRPRGVLAPCRAPSVP